MTVCSDRGPRAEQEGRLCPTSTEEPGRGGLSRKGGPVAWPRPAGTSESSVALRLVGVKADVVVTMGDEHDQRNSPNAAN